MAYSNQPQRSNPKSKNDAKVKNEPHPYSDKKKAQLVSLITGVIPSKQVQIIDHKAKVEMKKKEKEKEILHVMSRLHQDMLSKVAEGMDVDILARPNHYYGEMVEMEFLQEVKNSKPPNATASVHMQVDRGVKAKLGQVIPVGNEGVELSTEDH